MASNVRTLHTAHTYERAHAHFERTPRPRSKHWSDNERPLGDNSKHHYRIERGPSGEHYDINLYHTTMARYYRPDESGNRRVQYVWDNRCRSVQFMRHVVGVSKIEKYCTLDYKWVCVPISAVSGYSWFSTDLTFNADNKLILEQSSHEQIHRSVESPEGKEWRAKLREVTRTLFDLLELGDMPQASKHATQYSYPGSPFKENSTAKHEVRTLMACVHLWDGTESPIPERVVDSIRALWASCAIHAVQQQDYKGGDGHIDPSAVTRAALTQLYRLNPHSKVAVDVPAFPEEMSGSWYF